MTTPGKDIKKEFEKIYLAHRGTVLAFACSLCEHSATAEDLTQTIFVNLYHKLRGGLWIDNQKVYLLRAVRNLALNHFNRKLPEGYCRDQMARLLDFQKPAEDETDPRIVFEWLKEIPAEQRRVIELKHFHGMTFQEQADITGESINTLMSRYRIGMEKLSRKAQGEKQ